MEWKIRGDIYQVLEVELKEGESVYAEAGAMQWMDDSIEMEPFLKGGITGAIGRLLTKESLFFVRYKANGKGKVAFASSFPGKIVIVDVSKKPIIAQKDAFLVAEESVDAKTEIVRKLGAGIFGGEGFILQRFEGKGKVAIEISGEVVERELKEGETLLVDPGAVAAFEPTVDYDIQLNKGIKNILFGGEGIFLVKLRGPGKVWLQTSSPITLAQALFPYIVRK